MRRGSLVPTWLRRSLESALPAAAVTIAILVARLGTGPTPVALPNGLAGVLVLAPPVLGLAVITIAYPMAFAATRSDALLGAFASFLIAADATLLIVRTPLELSPGGLTVGAGVLVAVIAAAAATAGMVAGQLAGPIGFGRRAGAAAAITAAIAGLVAVIAVAAVGPNL